MHGTTILTVGDQGLRRLRQRLGRQVPEGRRDPEKHREALLAFYFPASHWQSIRTMTPLETTFATVRLRTAKTRGCVTRNSILSVVFRLGQSAQKRWRILNGYQWLEALERGVTFIDGVAEMNQQATTGTPTHHISHTPVLTLTPRQVDRFATRFSFVTYA